MLRVRQGARHRTQGLGQISVCLTEDLFQLEIWSDAAALGLSHQLGTWLMLAVRYRDGFTELQGHEKNREEEERGGPALQDWLRPFSFMARQERPQGSRFSMPTVLPLPPSISHAFLWNPEAAPRPVDLPNSLYRLKTPWVGLDLEGKWGDWPSAMWGMWQWLDRRNEFRGECLQGGPGPRCVGSVGEGHTTAV